MYIFISIYDGIGCNMTDVLLYRHAYEIIGQLSNVFFCFSNGWLVRRETRYVM